jgi:perosamine synthetase
VVDGRRVGRSWLIPVPRGRISQPVRQDVRWLLTTLVAPLEDPEALRRAEQAFAEHVGREHCVIFPFARTAVHATLQAWGLSPGDRILLPPVTIKPILDVVLGLDLVPVFVDIDPATACFSSEALDEALGERPRAAILTYLFGLVPDVDLIVGKLRSAGVRIIEDFSQCLNGEWSGRSIGTFGDVSVYSASSVKTFDTYGGGFLVVDDRGAADALRAIRDALERPRRAALLRKIATSLTRNLASHPIVFALLTFSAVRILDRLGRSGVTRFTGARPEEPLTELPREWFTRPTAIQARVAVSRLPGIQAKDRRRVETVHWIDAHHQYDDRPSGHPDGSHVHWQHIVYADDVAGFREQMARSGVDTGTTSLVLISELSAYRYRGDTPNGARLYRHGVYLPCYHQLRRREARRIAMALEATRYRSGVLEAPR